MTETAVQHDVVDLLIAQHTEIRDLISEVAAGGPRCSARGNHGCQWCERPASIRFR